MEKKKYIHTQRGGAEIQTDDIRTHLRSKALDEIISDNPGDIMLDSGAGRGLARDIIRGKAPSFYKDMLLTDFMKLKPKGMSLDDFYRLHFDKADPDQKAWDKVSPYREK